MKKAFVFILILLLIVLGLLFYVRENNNQVKESKKLNVTSDTSSNDLKITFLDVGQGDASLINFPDEEQMLVDCSEDARILEALSRVMDFYDNEIDYLLITHPDSDHYGGCEEVLNRFKVKNVIYTGYQKSGDSAWNNLMTKFSYNPDIKYLKIEGEQTWDIASTSLHFLYPDHSLEYNKQIPGSDKKIINNNTSVIFELGYKNNEILFMGDAESELEDYLLGKYDKILDVDVLKVGHHGSNSGSQQSFLDIVTANYAIISVGKNNKFGHPSARTIKKIERTNSNILRTDLNGDITCLVNESIVCK